MPPPRRLTAIGALLSKVASRLLPPTASASAGKKVVLSAPTESAVYTIHDQRGLERVLKNLGCAGSVLADEASKVRTSYFDDLRDSGRYVVLPPAARKVGGWRWGG